MTRYLENFHQSPFATFADHYRPMASQVYGTARNNDTSFLPFETTLTTMGYVSDGNNYPLTANGGNGADSFIVQRNRAPLSLYGDDGNDFFSVRAFVALDVNTLTPVCRYRGREWCHELYFSAAPLPPSLLLRRLVFLKGRVVYALPPDNRRLYTRLPPMSLACTCNAEQGLHREDMPPMMLGCGQAR
jgi:hypothetical protein